MFGGLLILLLVFMVLLIPVGIVIVVRLITAGRSEAGRAETVVAALRGSRATSMVSLAVFAAVLAVVGLMASSAQSARWLSIGPLAASLAALAVLALGETWGRRNRTAQRSAPLNARSGSVVASGGWLRAWAAGAAAMVVVVVGCGFVSDRLRGQVWELNAPPQVFPGWSTTGPQLLLLAVVALAWVGVVRLSVIRPTVPGAHVADDQALRRATATRATRAALVGTMLTLGVDLLLAAVATNGSDRVAASLVVGTAVLGALLVCASFLVLLLPASRMPPLVPGNRAFADSGSTRPS